MKSSTILHPKKVLILGSGGLRIGQAGEFDYSGSQAIKALKEEGIRTVLINPNIATVQTDESMADEVYFLPLTLDFVQQVIAKEKPDALLLSFGGQTALNVGLELEDAGVLKKHKVQILGTPTSAIRLTEDRHLFAEHLRSIDISVAKSFAVTSVKAGLAAAKKIGFPIMMRSAFALGGEGSGLVSNEKQLLRRLQEAFSSVPQVLIEEYLGGWKEIEYEVVRDKYDNCITVCNMENFDPMGVHTGESIVVAPSQTLSNADYHMLRSVAQKVVRSLGVVGECNIQYALDPHSREYRVIEVNARLSRSSALASKATGYPLAFVAAKLALGYGLLEVQNSITKTTTSLFEPALDYVVIKIPRWDLKKFKDADHKISTEMKSVGEIMAIGRTFEEALQKGLRMTAVGAKGLIANDFAIPDYLDQIEYPTDLRIYAIAEALQRGHSVEQLHNLSKIDRWFLDRLQNIVTVGKTVKKRALTKEFMRELKQAGFADEQIAILTNTTEQSVRTKRKKLGVLPVIKQIDTLAGEFPAKTNYLYLTYHGTENDVTAGKKQIVVLGGGPYRIGSSVEFDWCCVQAIKTVQSRGYQGVMINCNPETVSTDYDVCDRLYFEELSLERVMDIYDFEAPEGVIVSMGGQTPNILAPDLHKAKVKILGTHPDSIDAAEDRNRFSTLLDELGIDQPEWKELSSLAEAKKFANRVGYPVLIRPSYVLSGAAMNVAFTPENLEHYLQEAAAINSKHPVVISKFIENAREIEFDGVAQNGELKVYAMTEHIENAGVHSGDAHAVFPPQKTYLETIRRTKNRLRQVLKALNITGPFNIQFLAKDNQIKIIELNVRASRSFPFVSKSLKMNFASIAVQAMLGEQLDINFKRFDLDYVTVKAPQFSYSRIKGADPVLYVEMGSTGEAATFGDGYQEAVLKSMFTVGFRWPNKGILLSVGSDYQKAKLLPLVKKAKAAGYTLYGTEGTAEYYQSQGIKIKSVHKVSNAKKAVNNKNGKRAMSVLDLIESGKIDVLINVPRNYSRTELTDGFTIRRAAADFHVPLINNVQIAKIFLIAVSNLTPADLKVKAWSEYGNSLEV